MEFRILGPLEIVDDDDLPLSVGGSRERYLLTLLLLSANQVVSTERLVDEFWEDEPPTDPVHALPRLRLPASQRPANGWRRRSARNAAARLSHPPSCRGARRRALQHSGGCRAGSTGRRRRWRRGRDPTPGALVVAGSRPRRRARRAHRPGRSRPPGGGPPGRHRGSGRGRHGVRTPPGTGRRTRGRCAALDPLRERLWSQRMLALYRSGRQAEALRTYQEARRLHVDELGVEPSGALTRLERAILCQAHEIDWPADGREDTPSLPLPAEVAAEGFQPFVSRAEELAAAHVLLNDGTRDRLAVLWLLGEPGIGRTRVGHLESPARFHSAVLCLSLFDDVQFQGLATPYHVVLKPCAGAVLHPSRQRAGATSSSILPREAFHPPRPRDPRPRSR